MALTIDQQITLYTILGVPFSESVTVPSDPMYIQSYEYISSNGEQRIQLRIAQRLNELSNEAELRLIDLLEQFDLLDTNTVSIEGNIGGLQGVSYDPNIQLERIAARVKVIIPIMQYKIEMTNESMNRPLTSFGLR